MKNDWVEINGFPEYEIHPHDGVRRKGRESTLKARTWFGYPKVTLMRSGKKHERRVHKLVAEHFLPNKGGKPIVNHMDSDRSNHSVDNLEWVDNSENQLHRWKTQKEGLQKMKYEREYGLSKVASLSIGQRIAKDPGLQKRILNRLVGEGKALSGQERKIDSIVERASNKGDDGTGMRIFRKIMNHKHDGLKDVSLSNPVKRATYFKGKEGRGKMLISNSMIKDMDIERNGKQIKDSVESVKKDVTNAHDAVLSGSGNFKKSVGQIPSFKSFSKKEIPYYHATSKGNRAAAKEAISKGLMSNYSGAGQFLVNSNMPAKKGFFAYPERNNGMFPRRHHDIVKGKVMAKDVVFGRETSGSGNQKYMPEMFIESKNPRGGTIKHRRTA